MGKAVKKITAAAIGVAVFATTGNVALAFAAYAGSSAALGVKTIGSPKTPSSGAQLSRLTLTYDPDAPRKVWFGTTAGATDVLYSEPSGANQEFVDYIIAVAAHAVTSVDTIYSEDKVLWTLAGGVQGIYVGYLTVDVRLEGTSANGIAINGGTTWTTACTLTGCAYLHLRIKRTGATSKAESPFAGGLPGRMTVVGKGAKMYDPSRDSTRGGSGSHRADNQATWEYASGGTELGQNPALQSLWHLIGWRIGGAVSVGAGMPLARIDFADYITARNICDEAAALAAGGTQRRYETAGLFQDSDDPGMVQAALCTHMQAELRDVSGKLGIRIATNDLGGTLPAFTAADVLGAATWTGFAPLNGTKNVIRGRYTDPSTASLYQPGPFSKIGVTSPDGIDRADTLDLLMCQNAERSQRIATQVLLRQQFSGTFVADFGPRAWALKIGDPMTLSFPAAGLLNQKFRVASQGMKMVLDDDDATAFCPMTLEADDPAVYAYTPGVVALPAAAVPAVSYNPFNNPLAITDGVDIGVENGADVTADNVPTLEVAPSITISAAVDGAVDAGQLPRDVRAKRRKGTNDASATTVWTGTTFVGCTGTVDSTGLATITACASSGKIKWVSLADGVTLEGETFVEKRLADPPSPTGGGGGTGGGSAGSGSPAYDSTVTGTSSASYGAANAGPLKVTAGASGQVNLTAPLDYLCAAGATNVRGKWQWRVVGGTFADVAAEVAETYAAAHNPGDPLDPGYIEVNQSKTGLTSGTAYEFQLLLRKATGTTIASFTGTAAATPT